MEKTSKKKTKVIVFSVLAVIVIVFLVSVLHQTAPTGSSQKVGDADGALRAYAAQLQSIEQPLSNDLTDLGKFLQAHPYPAKWSQDDVSYREGQATEIKLAYSEAQNITPPPQLQAVHAETLEGLKNFSDAMDLLISAIDHPDTGKLDQAQALITQGQQKIADANAKLNKLLSQ